MSRHGHPSSRLAGNRDIDLAADLLAQVSVAANCLVSGGAEWMDTDKGIKALRQLAQSLNDTSRARLLDLLDRAERWLQLRHGVVHGIYRKNHKTGQHEGRRFVLNKDSRQYVLVREPYDRDTLMLAMTRASNTAAEIFDGVRDWHAQIVSAERRRIEALGPPHPLGIEGDDDETATLHALAHDSTKTVCGRDASELTSHYEVVFEWTNRKLHCPDCKRLIGV